MLIENVNGERKAASMLKDSAFYIELAKFVQAYSMIVKNPNEFLKEVNENLIDSKNDHLTWPQFTKIMQTCELGFKEIPTETELVVFYNYALEMGSLGENAKKVASVQDVADAQKHYYNFIDESTDKAETEYLKQKKIASNREREVEHVSKNLRSIKAKNVTAIVFMFIALIIFTFGLISMFFKNSVADWFGSFMNVSNASIVGGIVFIICGFSLFVIFNYFFVKSKHEYQTLSYASRTIFERGSTSITDTLVLKHKLESLQNNLKVVQTELADENKTYDVAFNIETLAKTNKFYKKFAGAEISFNNNLQATTPAKDILSETNLTKEQYENLGATNKEAIVFGENLNKEALEGRIVEQKFDVKEQEPEESVEVFSEYIEENDTKTGIINEEEIKNLQEYEKDQRTNS